MYIKVLSHLTRVVKEQRAAKLQWKNTICAGSIKKPTFHVFSQNMKASSSLCPSSNITVETHAYSCSLHNYDM